MTDNLGSPAAPGLIERLRQQAKGASEAERMMAQGKSARNQAAGDDGASYMWSKPEQTLEWQAADEIERLKTELSRAYRATYGLYNTAREARTPSDAMMGYHSLTFGAAARFVREGARIERAIDRVVRILSDAVCASGMTKDDCEDLREALRKLVAATKAP